MPPVISGQYGNSSSSLSLKDHSYSYPDGMDLKPGNKFHDKLRDRMLERARESRRVMSMRYPVWNKTEETLSLYIHVSEEDRAAKGIDENKPTSIIVPHSFAIMDTLLTSMVMTFLDTDTVFKYSPTGPEDFVGVELLQQTVADNFIRAKVGLNMRTMWRDGFWAGIGVAIPTWEVRKGTRTSIKKDPIRDFWQRITGTKKSRTKSETTLFEGNKLLNVLPYSYLPDTNAHDPQKAEFHSYVERDNLPNLLSEEANSDGDMFNVKYLEGRAGRSSLFYEETRGRGNSDQGIQRLNETVYTTPVDTLTMMVNIVPSQWDMGGLKAPEKWIFKLAADSVIIQAKKLNLDHGQYPIVRFMPDTDGYGITPMSRIELVAGLQEYLNFKVNSQIQNVRKSLHNMFIVNPNKVNMKDVENPGPGKLIRLKPNAFEADVNTVIAQLQVQDITARNIEDAMVIAGLMKETSGAVDQVQGVLRHTSERVSATQAHETRSSALSRLQMLAKLASMQAHQDIAMMFAAHQQQLMSEPMKAKLTGRLGEVLQKEYGHSFVEITPEELVVAFDVIPHDGTSSSDEYNQSWKDILQMIMKDPAVAQMYDIDGKRVFQHVARIHGAKDIQDFLVQGGNVQGQVMPPEQLDNERQAGNVIPVPGSQI